VDECAERGAQIHPALGVHALQCLTYGLPADPQGSSQIFLDQMLTRLQLACDDHLDEGLEDRLAQRCRTFDEWRLRPRSFSESAPGGAGQRLGHGPPFLSG
jgi:hypothetical protein